VLECLGEVQMENEMWHESVTEFEKALDVKMKLLPPDHRYEIEAKRDDFEANYLGLTLNLTTYN